jgi:hypothetical protein
MKLNIKIDNRTVIPFSDNFARFRSYLMKHTGLSKDDIVKESDDCYLIRNQIFGYNDCIICAGNDY